MGKINKILEDILHSLNQYYIFLESLDGSEINATGKATLIDVRNLAIAIVNEVNRLIAKKNGLR